MGANMRIQRLACKWVDNEWTMFMSLLRAVRARVWGSKKLAGSDGLAQKQRCSLEGGGTTRVTANVVYTT
jgi:hypothetical protein